MSEDDDRGGGFGVSTLELFFDLVFVFAITQVTALIAAEPTATGLVRGVLLLALVWWSWVAFTWVGTTVRADLGLPALVFGGAMALMLVVAATLPSWFAGTGAAWVAVGAYLGVRLMHLGLFLALGRGMPGLAAAAARLGIGVLVAAVLLLAGTALGGGAQLALVALAVAIDFAGALIGRGEGWVVNVSHFAERHGLIVIIALGESLIALGLAASGVELGVGVVAALVLGFGLAAAVWLVYFTRQAAPLEHAVAARAGAARARIARDVYSYLHYPLVLGVVLIALALKKGVDGIAADGLGAAAHGMGAIALAVGAPLVLAALVAMRLRTRDGVPPALLVGLAATAVAGIAGLAAPLLLVVAVQAAIIAACTVRRPRGAAPA